MAFSSCLCRPLSSLRNDNFLLQIAPRDNLGVNRRLSSTLRSTNTELHGQRFASPGTCSLTNWSFVGGSRITIQSNSSLNFVNHRKLCGVQASWLTTSQIASSAFTVGTVAVLPFYTLMVVAPKAELTKKSMESAIPYVVLGIFYAYLLYLSWTPETLRYMFASKYMLPELSGMAKMFSSEMTLASAWIHLLVVDLFAARQVFQDGLKNEVETRHSVSLCLLFCPIGIVSHCVTKALTKGAKDTGHGM